MGQPAARYPDGMRETEPSEQVGGRQQIRILEVAVVEGSRVGSFRTRPVPIKNERDPVPT